MQYRYVHTVIYWIILAIFFIGVVGYEWLPTGYRGSWLFVLALVISGAFVRFTTAILIGLGAFFAVSIYFLFDLTSFSHIERQILLLFTVAFAPLSLSAVRYNLISTHQANQAIQHFNFGYSNEVLPLQSWEHMTTELFKMLPFLSIDYYEIVHIQIKNQQLIAEMLGDAVWKDTQNEILKLLREKSDGAIYHFANNNLNEIRSIIIRNNPGPENLPLFITALKQIESLEIEYDYTLRDISASIKEGKYVSPP